LRSYAGRSAGAHFLDEMFMSKDYVYVASRWISPEYAKKLVQMTKEGVAVRIITSDDKEKNHQKALEILKKALKPPAFARIKGWNPPNMELGIIREQYLHVKLYVFDDKMAVVGSANLTKNGMWNNIEHVVIFDKPEEVQQLKHDFEKLWKLYTEDKQAAKEVTSLADIARKLGKTVAELVKMFKRK
jgi:phosphatidylserine/phosphatidylglycerophosphate/cardiolipin synthase-like enzyme